MIRELLASVIVSGLGACLAYVTRRGWTLYRASRFDRLSVTGTYETELALTASGPAHRALTRIEQRGRAIQAVITELAHERAWQLEGEIDASGFLRGTYKVQGASKILGTFLLAIDPEGVRLDGFWAGFEAASRDLSSVATPFGAAPDCPSSSVALSPTHARRSTFGSWRVSAIGFVP